MQRTLIWKDVESGVSSFVSLFWGVRVEPEGAAESGVEVLRVTHAELDMGNSERGIIH